MSSSSSTINLPTNNEGWSSEKVMSEVQDHALAQWNSNEAAFSIAEHVVRSEDIYMITNDGRKIIDWNSQAVCVNLGYSCPEIAEAVYDQMKNGVAMAESRWYVTGVRSKVIDHLRGKMPGMDRFYFSESGATAVEAAIRLARAYTGRPMVLASSRSYHGSTSGAMTLTGGTDDRHFTANNGMMENVVHFIDHEPFHMSWGNTEDEKVDKFLEYLDEMLATQGPNRVAAILIESMVGTQGAVPSPTKYILGVQALCRKYGCLLILDEVMGGFCRTGKYFAYQHHDGLQPDIVTMAKGLTNAFAPLGAVAVNKAVGDYFNKNPVPIGSTYNCHPVGLAAAWATLQLYEKRNTLAYVQNEIAPLYKKKMEALMAENSDIVLVARATGMHGALQLKCPSPAENKEVNLAAPAAALAVMKAKGMCTLCRYHRHMRGIYIMCNPPLCITPAQLDDAFAILTEVVAAVRKALN